MSKVTVFIDRNALKFLAEDGFNLCLTRDVRVNGKALKGNVVFATVPAENLAPVLQLNWEDRYQIFETNSYKEGAKVIVDTKIADVGLGQLAMFDTFGNVRVTGQEDKNKPLVVRNEWKDARAGIKSYDPNTGTYHSFFLSPETPIGKEIKVTPTKTFTIFWRPDTTTDTIIDEGIADSYVFEITGDEITLKYSTEWPHWTRA